MIKAVDGEGNLIAYNEDNPIEKGGEGKIYEPVGGRYSKNEYLIKIFCQKPDESAETFQKNLKAKEDKINYMLQNCPIGSKQRPLNYSDGSKRIVVAWPYSVILTLDGGFVGYIMPRVNYMMTMSSFFLDYRRKKIGLKLNTKQKLQTIRLLALVFKSLHDSGLYGLDGNPENYVIDRQSWITLIDTDAYQIHGSQKIYRGDSYLPDMAPPEYLKDQDKGKEITLTKYGDYYIFAMFAFRILVNGAHSHNGIPRPEYRNDKNVMVGAEQHLYNRKQGWFMYGDGGNRNRYFIAPPNEEKIYEKEVSPKIHKLFCACFEQGTEDFSARPTIEEWIKILNETLHDIDNGMLKTYTVSNDIKRNVSCPVTFVIDVTTSLEVNGAWEPLKQGFHEMLVSLKENVNCSEVDFSLIEFTSKPILRKDFVALDTVIDQLIQNDELEMKIGYTNFMGAVEYAVERSISYMNQRINKGEVCKKPKIIIMTDGAYLAVNDLKFRTTYDYISYISKRKQECEIICVALGEVDVNAKKERDMILKGTATNEQVIYVKGSKMNQNLKELFQWFSVSTGATRR